MKKIKLRKINRMKMCPICEEIVEIIMIGKHGYCPSCKKKDMETKLYTTDSRVEKRK